MDTAASMERTKISSNEEHGGDEANSSSLDDGNGEGVVYNHRGWKAMPYVVCLLAHHVFLY